MLSYFITNLTIFDQTSILLVNSVLVSLTRCPEEISRAMAVKFFNYKIFMNIDRKI